MRVAEGETQIKGLVKPSSVDSRCSAKRIKKATAKLVSFQ